jgi:hypothetical protein
LEYEGKGLDLRVTSLGAEADLVTSDCIHRQLPQVFLSAHGPKPTLSSRIDGHARDELSPAGAGQLRRAASSAAIARLLARP